MPGAVSASGREDPNESRSGHTFPPGRHRKSRLFPQKSCQKPSADSNDGRGTAGGRGDDTVSL